MSEFLDIIQVIVGVAMSIGVCKGMTVILEILWAKKEHRQMRSIQRSTDEISARAAEQSLRPIAPVNLNCKSPIYLEWSPPPKKSIEEIGIIAYINYE